MEKNINYLHKVPDSTKDRDAIIGQALADRMGRETAEGSCVSLEEIAAFVDRTLPESDRNRIMGHLAVCERCYRIFSMTSELQRPEQESTGQRRGWYVVSGIAAAAAVAALVIRLSVQSPQELQKVAQQIKPVVPQVAVAPVPDAIQNDKPPPKPVVAARQQVKKPIDKPVQLLTDEEAAMGEAKTFGFSAELPKDGPFIKVLQPEVDKELQPPFRLFIKFVPMEGRSVDLNTLKVEALKFVNIDLTSRVKPYVSAEGINMEKANIPSGNHKIRVTIGDVSGGVTQKIFTMKVL